MAAQANQARTSRGWNPALVVLGVVLAAAGFFGSLLLARVASPTPSVSGSATMVVASRDLPVGTQLAPGDLKIISIAPADVPPGALAKAADGVGRVLQAPLRAGQPVLGNQVAPADTGGSFSTGYVAATLPAGELVGVGGYIRAGDYIDVIAIVTPKAGGASNVRTIYSGVHVIRVGAAGGSGQGVTNSITVAVTECQAEFLNWFVSNASIRYTLLSHDDFAAAASAPRDGFCPASSTVSEADVRSHWPGLLG